MTGGVVIGDVPSPDTSTFSVWAVMASVLVGVGVAVCGARLMPVLLAAGALLEAAPDPPPQPAMKNTLTKTPNSLERRGLEGEMVMAVSI
ncbi:MAG: hypothetical protein B7Z83_11275 [Thiomonas sp. 20-64-5]|nr:MAG: hypothetical protein B7Z83_11275 [Thiomonas sp. 20-64-5]